MNIMNFNTL